MINKNKLLLHPFLKKMLKNRYILIPLLLLTLFVTYQASITLFAHIHYVNGVMIVHSHPSSDSEHTHTESQILTLAQVSEWAGTEPVFVTLDQVCRRTKQASQTDKKHKA